MTVRARPLHLATRTTYRPHDECPPRSAFLGPRAQETNRKGMADALGQIAAAFGGATHLASIELPNGRWLCITTN